MSVLSLPFGQKKHSVIPGFGITLGLSLFYLSMIVLIPLGGLFFQTAEISLAEFWQTVTDSRIMHAYKISFGLSFVAALVNVVFGLVVAWVLVRYRFPGKKLVDACVDLPFAMPTAVSGIALAALYAQNGWIGEFLYNTFGLKVAFTPVGIAVALVFIGLPFVVRTVEPVLEDFDKEMEEASANRLAICCACRGIIQNLLAIELLQYMMGNFYKAVVIGFLKVRDEYFTGHSALCEQRGKWRP